MTNIVQSNYNPLPGEIENVLVNGDISSLQPQERVIYYNNICDSIGLNPATRPFEYIRLNGKIVLYARKDATEQLRKLHHVSIENLDTSVVGDLYVAKANARDGKGRSDTDIGCVKISGLSGDALANAMMKAVTKAKRRVTLSICGLGFLDETELETIPDSVKSSVDLTEISAERQKKIDEIEKLAFRVYGASTLSRFSKIVSVIGRNRKIPANINSIYDLSLEEMETVLDGMWDKYNAEEEEEPQVDRGDYGEDIRF